VLEALGRDGFVAAGLADLHRLLSPPRGRLLFVYAHELLERFLAVGVPSLRVAGIFPRLHVAALCSAFLFFSFLFFSILFSVVRF
jgi:hypothetical protein